MYLPGPIPSTPMSGDSNLARLSLSVDVEKRSHSYSYFRVYKGPIAQHRVMCVLKVPSGQIGSA